MFQDSSDLLTVDSVLSVAGLTAYLQMLLEEDPHLQQVWVTGEVSSTNAHRSGLFFTLQDPDSGASINCVVWKSGLDRLVCRPEPGTSLVVLGRIALYPQRGSYQLTVWQALPAGEGLRALRYRQLRSRLEAEGLFDVERKRSLPPHPHTLAVVTSPQAAAWGDIQRTLNHRYPGLTVLLSPAIVQGEQAPASIVRAIQRVEQDGRAQVLILSRGGGAVEDLACFNDERVVRAVAECSIPVVAGIGHQRDESLADLAADVCAHTPTAAAELTVPRWIDVYEAHQERIVALQQATEQYFDYQADRLDGLRDRLERLRLDHRLHQQQQTLAWLRQRLLHSTRHLLHQEVQRCQLLRQTLQTLDPAAVLQRGYAVVRQENRAIVRSVQDVAVDEVLEIQLGDGTVRVQAIEKLPGSV
ncbi:MULTISPECIES: exodeoxyribonuclease VII large subunit [unclassified Leptolyngbya]|uniref:exodeoxyribonuclease VII large subunit n=1 Tax=unclassified Leptolyngbya TaxID=2650499 RepID=UPI001687D3C5|nr:MULTISPECIES: exodeoxyribonuclease VII large subunit [unclassified Leptolyngbya]MBD1911049.1 exodeoxyribonuclease VII large subunit [Leptolyngbya sp. FACHB-8]MBD2158285.1 exodeoxyribonuclease VII large subunit [Leptolyngbya sp. FACHB-16]